jgi:ABC-type cobalt transport system substrate-binding protein
MANLLESSGLIGEVLSWKEIMDIQSDLIRNFAGLDGDTSKKMKWIELYSEKFRTIINDPNSGELRQLLNTNRIAGVKELEGLLYLS